MYNLSGIHACKERVLILYLIGMYENIGFRNFFYYSDFIKVICFLIFFTLRAYKKILRKAYHSVTDISYQRKRKGAVSHDITAVPHIPRTATASGTE